MKRIISLVILTVLTLSILSVCASAAPAINADEQRILDIISSSVMSAGVKVTLHPSWLNQAKNYLSYDEVDLTKEEADAIIAYLYKGIALIESSTYCNGRKFTTDINNQLFFLANDAGAILGLTFVHPGINDDKIQLKDAQGNIVYESSNTIKATGADVNVAAIAVCGVVVLMAIGGALCVKKFEL